MRIDRMCERLRAVLPDDVRLIITGDHGMVDVPYNHQVIAEDHPALMAGVSALAGESRFRQVYVDADDRGASPLGGATRSGRSSMGGTRTKRSTRDGSGRSIALCESVRADDLVALREDHAVMTRQFPRELTLIGMHGSLTPAEMIVPLFCD